jgi:hypothetical protein
VLNYWAGSNSPSLMTKPAIDGATSSTRAPSVVRALRNAWSSVRRYGALPAQITAVRRSSPASIPIHAQNPSSPTSVDRPCSAASNPPHRFRRLFNVFVERPNVEAVADSGNGCLPGLLSGADDGIRTRDPHLGKVMVFVRLVSPGPLSRFGSFGSSAQSVESAPLRPT